MHRVGSESWSVRIVAVVTVAWLMSAAGADARGTDGKRGDKSQEAGWTRIRPLEKRAAAAIRAGYDRSTTFRALVDEIEASDLVVYVDTNTYRAHATAAFLQFMTKRAGLRYVLAWVDPRQGDQEMIALLGHELQHAVEVARARDVSTGTDFDALYRSLGHRSGPEEYETAAGHDAADRIRHELSMSDLAANALHPGGYSRNLRH